MSKTDLSQTRKRILAIIEAKWFQYGIVLLIVVNAAILFRNGWNVFDFLVVVAALLPAGSASSALRLFRLLRVFRLLSTVKMMRLVIGALGASRQWDMNYRCSLLYDDEVRSFRLARAISRTSV